MGRLTTGDEHDTLLYGHVGKKEEVMEAIEHSHMESVIGVVETRTVFAHSVDSQDGIIQYCDGVLPTNGRSASWCKHPRDVTWCFSGPPVIHLLDDLLNTRVRPPVWVRVSVGWFVG
jgi:hypothetical protein